MVLKADALRQDIVKLGVEGLNQTWRGAKLRAVGSKSVKTLLSAAEHSIGSQEAPESARLELKKLLDDAEEIKATLYRCIYKNQRGKFKNTQKNACISKQSGSNI